MTATHLTDSRAQLVARLIRAHAVARSVAQADRLSRMLATVIGA